MVSMVILWAPMLPRYIRTLPPVRHMHRLMHMQLQRAVGSLTFFGIMHRKIKRKLMKVIQKLQEDPVSLRTM